MSKMSWIFILLAVFGGLVIRLAYLALVVAVIFFAGSFLWDHFGPEIQAMIAEPTGTVGTVGSVGK